MQEEFSDVTSIADSKDGDKCSSSFDTFTPDAISSPRSGYCTEPMYYSFVYKSDLNLKERESFRMTFNAAHDFTSSQRRAFHSSCSSIETLRSLQPQGGHRMKYASTTSLFTVGQKPRFIGRKWSSKMSLVSSHTNSRSMSSGFLDKTWSSKYASSLSISTLARSVSSRTIGEDVESMFEGCENLSEEQGYGTLESSTGFSNDVMEMNITTISDCETEGNVGFVMSRNIPTYDMNLLTPSRTTGAACDRITDALSSDSSWINDFHINENATDAFDEIVELFHPVPSDTFRYIEGDNDIAASSCESVVDLGIDLISSAEETDAYITSDTFYGTTPITSPVSCSNFTFETAREFNNFEYAEEMQAENDICSCPQTKSKGKKDKVQRTLPRRKTRPAKLPRTFATKRHTQISVTKIDTSAKSNTVVTRSPSKHMRSYIALRQQSRYSDHERQSGAMVSEDEKVQRKKKAYRQVTSYLT